MTSQSLDKTKKKFDTIYKALLVEMFIPKLFTCLIRPIATRYKLFLNFKVFNFF